MHPHATESLTFSTSNGISDADHFDSHDMTEDGGEAGPVDEHQRVCAPRHSLGLEPSVLLAAALEERPLLETSANVFAYLDLLLSTRDQKDPRGHMAQVAKWYLPLSLSCRRERLSCQKAMQHPSGCDFMVLSSQGMSE